MGDRLRLTLIINFSFILFLSLSIGIIYRITEKSILERTNLENLLEIDTIYSSLENYISRLEASVANISRIENIESYLTDKNETDKKAVEELFKGLVEYSTKTLLPTYNHMRILGLDGREMVRINLLENGKAEIVDSSSLQNKSDRYYFEEIKEVCQTSPYLSRIDLNIENGEIETPYKPVIRAANGIFNKEKELIGYIIINVDFNAIATHLQRLKGESKVEWFLVNKDGHYLINRDKEKEFTFMFPDMADIGFISDFPSSWKCIIDDFKPIIEDESGYLYFKVLDLGKVTETNNKNTLYIGNYLTNRQLKEKNSLLNRGVIIGFILLAPLLIFIGILLGKSISDNRFYIERLKDSSTHDKLTGLLNYQGTIEKATLLTELATRMNKTLYAVFIDLNDLKKINDSHGHKAGDKLIILMGEIIAKEIRITDAPGRLGGDEYIILLFDLHEGDLIKIMERIELDFAKEGEKLFGWKTRFSWGQSSWKGSEDDIESFISRADDNMYKMKRKFKT